MTGPAGICFRINAQDEIIFVNDEWSTFAIQSGTPELSGDKILHRSIWNFITGMSVDALYRQILQRVRSGVEMEFDLRSDTPEVKRLLRMTVTHLGDGEVEFKTRLVWQKERTVNALHDTVPPHQRKVVMTCSWCNRVEVAANEWKEIEEAFDIINFFRYNELPKLSHGICGDCYIKMSENIRRELENKQE